MLGTGTADAKKRVRLEKAGKARVVNGHLRIVALTRGTPRKVAFAIDGRSVYVTKSAPYRFRGATGTLNPASLKTGRHRITVRAYFGRKRSVARTVIRVKHKRLRVAGKLSRTTKVVSSLPVETAAGATNAGLGALLASDMNTPSELRPTLTNNWADQPLKRAFPPNPKFGAMTAWGVLDNARSGNPQPNAKVQIASIDTWLFIKSSRAWVRIQAEAGLTDGHFYTNSFDGATLPAQQVVSAYGGAAIGSIPQGFNFHFFPRSGRTAFRAGDIGAMIVMVRARLQPGTYDPARALPAYTLCASADWWVSTNAPWMADYSNNQDAGIGRFKRVDKDMRLYTMSAGDLSTLPPVAIANTEIR